MPKMIESVIVESQDKTLCDVEDHIALKNE